MVGRVMLEGSHDSGDDAHVVHEDSDDDDRYDDDCHDVEMHVATIITGHFSIRK